MPHHGSDSDSSEASDSEWYPGKEDAAPKPATKELPDEPKDAPPLDNITSSDSESEDEEAASEVPAAAAPAKTATATVLQDKKEKKKKKKKKRQVPSEVEQNPNDAAPVKAGNAALTATAPSTDSKEVKRDPPADEEEDEVEAERLMQAAIAAAQDILAAAEQAQKDGVNFCPDCGRQKATPRSRFCVGCGCSFILSTDDD